LNRCFKISLFFTGILSAIALFPIVTVGVDAETISLHRKNIPAITLKNLSPPYKDYDYFQNSKYVSFERRTSSFCLINAWRPVKNSTLAYANDAWVSFFYQSQVA